MRLCWSIALLVAMLVAPAEAAADLIYRMEWQRTDSFFTLIPVNRTNPDGSVTPFDEVHRTDTTSGLGVLRLAPTDLMLGPGLTWYDASLDGVFLANVGLGASPAVQPQCLHSPPLCGGDVTAEGDPDRPSRLSLGLFDGDSPHCLFNCTSTEFRGLARLVAPEPATGSLLVGLGLGLAAFVVRRRR